MLLGSVASWQAYRWVRTHEDAPTDEASGGLPSLPSLLLLGGGGVTTLLLACYARQILIQSQQVRQQVAERTEELRATQVALEKDIARRVETERALAKSEERYRAFVSQSREPIWLCEFSEPILLANDLDTVLDQIFARGFLAECNDAMAQAYGYSHAREIIGQPLSAMMVPEDPQNRAYLRAALTAPGIQLSDVESHEVDRHGQPRVFLNSLIGIVENGRLLRAWGTQRDVTERRRAEQAVQESRQLLDSVMSQLPGMAMRCLPDAELHVTYVSPGAFALTGHSAADFLACRVLLTDLVYPADLARLQEALTSALSSALGYEVEYPLRHRDGTERWVLDRGQAMRDGDGRITHVDRLLIDIGARKEAEKQTIDLERRLHEGQRLESLGVLSGGMAHEFNNLLTGIVGNAALIGAGQSAGSPLLHHVHEIESSARRAADLCNQLLAYAGKGRFSEQTIDVRAFLETTIPLLKLSVPKRGQLTLQIPDRLPSIRADGHQVRQALMNLLINAAEALEPNDGVITLSAGFATGSSLSWETAALRPEDPAADFVWIEVRDTGAGMTPETHAHIFEPFFTTKFAGRGLGLPAVLGILRSHRGGVTVSSAPRRGTSVRLLFPVTPVAAPATEPARPSAVPRGSMIEGAGRALLIDDEPAVRIVAERMLQMCGFSVDAASDGLRGIEKFDTEQGRFHVVVLDLTMPGKGGEEVLRHIRQRQPVLPVLLMSGFAQKEAGPLLGDGSCTGFLAKPFSFNQLKEQLAFLVPTFAAAR